MNINIICVGKLKEKYLKEGMDEYIKRLNRYCNINIFEVEDEEAPEGLSLSDEEIIKNKEAVKIKRFIKPNAYTVALDILGKSLSSEEFSNFIEKLAVNGYSDITFIIGGSIGLSYEILDNVNFKMSFSKMTFPHQLMRLILLEQVYRGFKIIKNEPYHK